MVEGTALAVVWPPWRAARVQPRDPSERLIVRNPQPLQRGTADKDEC